MVAADNLDVPDSCHFISHELVCSSSLGSPEEKPEIQRQDPDSTFKCAALFTFVGVKE